MLGAPCKSSLNTAKKQWSGILPWNSQGRVFEIHCQPLLTPHLLIPISRLPFLGALSFQMLIVKDPCDPEGSVSQICRSFPQSNSCQVLPRCVRTLPRQRSQLLPEVPFHCQLSKIKITKSANTNWAKQGISSTQEQKDNLTRKKMRKEPQKVPRRCDTTLVLSPDGDQVEHGRHRAPLGHSPPVGEEEGAEQSVARPQVQLLRGLGHLGHISQGI